MDAVGIDILATDVVHLVCLHDVYRMWIDELAVDGDHILAQSTDASLTATYGNPPHTIVINNSTRIEGTAVYLWYVSCHEVFV